MDWLIAVILFLVPTVGVGESDLGRPLPGALAAEFLIRWGNSCAGHCSTDTKATSHVSLVLRRDGSVHAQDRGADSFQHHSRVGGQDVGRKWDFAWDGTWLPCAEGFLAILDVTRSECTYESEYSNINARIRTKEDGACDRGAANLTLRCTPEEILLLEETASHVGFLGELELSYFANAAPVTVWSCEELDQDTRTGHPGTRFSFWRLSERPGFYVHDAGLSFVHRTTYLDRPPAGRFPFGKPEAR